MSTFNLADAVARRAPIPTYKPSPEDEKFIRDSMAFLVMKHPFWAHLLYNEMRIEYVDLPQIPFGATDSYTIFVNPKVMRKGNWTFAQVAFMLAHEVAHFFFGDLIMMVKYDQDGQVALPGNKSLPYSAEVMNWAEDYRINAMLIEGKVGVMPPVGLFDKNLSEKGMEPAVEIYEKIFKQSKGGKSGNFGGGGSFDIHLKPGSKATDADKAGKRQQAVVAAVQAAEAAGQGNLPAALKVLLGEIVEPHVPWQEFLKSTMMRKSGDPIYDWRYLDKRLLVRDPQMYFARQGHMGAGTIVIGYDTSGSCVNEQYQTRFFSEMAGIVADLNPAELIVVWCDAKVQRVDEIEEPEDLEELRMEINKLGGAPGGGGTSFIPVFTEIDKRGIVPDMLVYLTDTYGSFPPQEPDYPVIWASVVKNPNVPWGDVVEVDL